jgi:hypothetical protein
MSNQELMCQNNRKYLYVHIPEEKNTIIPVINAEMNELLPIDYLTLKTSFSDLPPPIRRKHYVNKLDFDTGELSSENCCSIYSPTAETMVYMNRCTKYTTELKMINNDLTHHDRS